MKIPLLKYLKYFKDHEFSIIPDGDLGDDVVEFSNLSGKIQVFVMLGGVIDSVAFLDENGNFHRHCEEGPAYIRFTYMKISELHFYKNGEFHRPIRVGAASIRTNMYGGFDCITFAENGQLIKDIIFKNGKYTITDIEIVPCWC